MNVVRRHPLLTQLALFAALLMAFAPGVSRMLAEPSNPIGTIVEAMCTKVGMQYISLPMSIHAKEATPASKHAETCGYCALLSGTALLAIAILIVACAAVARVVLPRPQRVAYSIRCTSTLGARGPPLYA